jgi:hypothetical protein
MNATPTPVAPRSCTALVTTTTDMAASPLEGRSDRAPTACFSLDSHHLAVLDRFVARARRHARGSGRPFTGVVIEIDRIRSVSVHAAGLESLVLTDSLAHVNNRPDANPPDCSARVS